MMVTGWPLDRSMYPRTERCDVKDVRICSISGDGSIVEACDIGAVASDDENIGWGCADLTDMADGLEVRVAGSALQRQAKEAHRANTLRRRDTLT